MPTAAEKIEELLGQNLDPLVIQSIILRQYPDLNGYQSAKLIQEVFKSINPDATNLYDISGLDLSTTDIPYAVAGPGLPASLNYGNLPLSPGLGGAISPDIGGQPGTYAVAGPGLPASFNWGDLPLSPGLGGVPPTYRGTAGDRAQNVGVDIGGQPGTVTAVPQPAGVTADADFTTLFGAPTQREILSRTRPGRLDIFNAFLENLPGARNFSNLLQRGLQETFNPLSAQFALQSNIPGPAGGFGPQDFRSFMKAGPERFTQQDWLESLGPLRMAFGDAPPIGSEALRGRFENQAIQNNLMAQIMGGNIAPGLREFLPGIINRRRTSMFDVDPEANIWSQFLASDNPVGF